MKTIARQPGSGRKSTISEEIRDTVEKAMRDDDEASGIQLHQILSSHDQNLS